MADPALAPGQERENALRDGGFNDDEISGWKSDTASTLQQGGFSAQEVRDYFGQKIPDMANAKAEVKKNLAKPQDASVTSREPIDMSLKPIEAKDVWDAMAAGWGNSVLGLATSGGQSPIQVNPNAGIAQAFASNATQMLGDAPAAVAGFLGGGAAGAAAGTATVPGVGTVSGGAVGAMAGAFAVPATMRKILIDHYQKGDIQDAGDFARRVVDTTWEGAKGAITGAATALTGGAIGPVAGTAARMASEVAAQTVVSSALEGKLPQARDFINGAVAIGGLHAVGFGLGKTGYIAEKLQNIYGETGALPHEVAEAANNDPAFKGDLLSQNVDLPKEATPTPAEEPKAEPAEIKPNADRDAILSRIGEAKDPDTQSLAEKVKDNFVGAYTKYLDYTKVIGDVTKEIGDQPLNEKNAQVLMRLHAAVSDKVREFVENGTRDFTTGEINGEPLTKIFDDYKESTGDESLNDLKAYGIAARAAELEGRGLQHDIPKTSFVEDNPQIKPFFDRLVDYKNRTLDYLGDSGRYSDEQIQAMKDMNKQYISFRKVLEPDPLTGKTASTVKAIQKIGSSDAMLQDPILSTLQDTDRMVRMANENFAKKTFVDQMSQAEDPGQFFRVAENPKGALSSTQFEAYDNGVRTVYEAPEEVVDSVNRMSGNPQALGTWTSLMRWGAQMLRIGTVNNPLFALRHAWRNQITALTLSQTGLKPFQALLYAPEYLAKGDSYHNFVYDGGAVQSIMPLDKGYLDGEIYKLDEKAPFLDKAWNNLKTVGAVSHAMIIANDNIVRFAEYSRMLDKGATRTESAFAAREVLPDFQKAGLQKSALQSITAFLNVHAQGMSRMGQELGSNPAGYLAKNLAYITVPSMLLAAAQGDDDQYKDLPNWQKYNYWNVHLADWRPANSQAEALSVQSAYPSNVRKTPEGKFEVNDGTMFRIQKPFTNGIFFGSVVEASLDAWKKQDSKGFGDFVSNVAGSAAAVPIPTTAVPMVEQAVNRNFYKGQPLVRSSMENKVPEMQYDRYTSDTARVLGQLVSYVPLARDIGPKDAKLSSPVVIDNYIKGWTGTLGHYAVDVLDQGLEKAGITPERVKPTSTLADIPFVREFVVRYPDAHPQSVSDFEDRYGQANRVQNSIKQLMKQGDFNGAADLQSRYAMNMDRMHGIDAAIRNMNAAVQKVDQSPDIDPVQKRQLIDGMMYQMTSTAKVGNKLMDEFEKSVKNKKAGN